MEESASTQKVLVIFSSLPSPVYGTQTCAGCFTQSSASYFLPIWLAFFSLLCGLLLVYCYCLYSMFFHLTSSSVGVVVNPALAIPYATGIVVFFTNLSNVKNSLINWQQLVVDEVLEQLVPFLNISIANQKENIQSVVKTVLDSLTSSSEKTTASDMKPLVDVMNALRDNLQNDHHEFTFRKFKESEIRELLRSLWFSIREELGLSTRNVFIVVISSSLILGLLLMFIFIGIATQHIRRTR